MFWLVMLLFGHLFAVSSVPYDNIDRCANDLNTQIIGFQEHWDSYKENFEEISGMKVDIDDVYIACYASSENPLSSKELTQQLEDDFKVYQEEHQN